MSVDGRLRNELSRDASEVDVDVERFLDHVVTGGRRRRRLQRMGRVVVVMALIGIAIAIGPVVLDAIRHQPNVPVAPSPTKGTPVADPLVGVWQSRTTPAELQALANGRFSEAQTPAWQHFLQRTYRHNGRVRTTTVQFEGGQLSVISSRDGRPARSEWDGAYEVVNDHTFVAGDNGTFYITYRFQIVSNRLTVHVVKDLFPRDVGPNPAKIPDLVPQVLLWETAPFTKVG